MSSKWQTFFDFKIRLFQWKVKNVAYREFTVDSGWDSSSAIVCKHELEICNLLIKQCRYYTLGWQVGGCEDSSCIMKCMDWLEKLGVSENLKTFEKYARNKTILVLGTRSFKKYDNFTFVTIIIPYALHQNLLLIRNCSLNNAATIL